MFVAVNGRVVVDAHGGHRDKARTQPIAKDDKTNIFSCGKVLEAMAVAVAADKGLLALIDPIAKHWPEFAAHGKGGITVGDLLAHRSGVATAWSEEPALEILQDSRKRDEFLVDQKPFRPPGYVMYRAWASAFYTDAIIRRVDPAGRSLAAFVQQEIMDKVGGTIVCPPIKFNDNSDLIPVQEASLVTILFGMVAQVYFPLAWRQLLGKKHMMAMTSVEAQSVYNLVTRSNDVLANSVSLPDADKGAASYNNDTSLLSYPMMSGNCFSNAPSTREKVIT